MKRVTTSLRKEAQRLFLTGTMDTNSEIAAHLGVKPHTIGRWRRLEGWDETRRKAETHLWEKQARAHATKAVQTNVMHLKAWDFLLAQLVETLSNPDPLKVKMLERQANVLERTQKGQRLGRGLHLDGQTEERIRAEGNAAMFKLIDLFIDTVKECVADEETRDRIGQRILAALPRQAGVGAEDEGQPGKNRSAR